MQRILAFALVYFLGAISAGAALAQDRPIDLTSKGANVFSAPGGQSLTLPSQAAPSAVVGGFLQTEGHSPQTIGSLVISSEGRVERTGITHLRFTQVVDGLSVYGTYVKAAINDDGELVHLIENLATPPAGGLLRSVIDEQAALDAALDEVHPGVFITLTPGRRDGNTVRFSGDDFFYQDPAVTRVAIPMQSGVLQEGYLVETWTQEENLLHHTLIGGSGRVLKVELRTNNDSYNIFPDHPGNSSQTVTAGPGAGNTESPIGWLSGSQTTVDIAGNNAHAYLDTDANNASDGGGSSVTDGNFLTSANLSQEPETAGNQEVAVQNLFYFNNVIHDKLYRHGFVEGVGNFQENNFGNGGSGSDSVNAEAQDGSGTNNANFATPSDGSNPRMQMYVWTQTSPKRDGDVDSDIIWHEYGHGLTWRMIGSMSGPMSGAIGEGMSDVLAILINNNDVVAEFSTDDPIGIRSAPYTNYPRTYGEMTGSSVHFDGEIYAAIGWRLGELFDQNGVTNDTLFDYIVDGMNYTPAGPAFEDMRDGILQAAAGSGDECLIWEAFAAYGVGEGAQGEATGGGGPFPCGPFGNNCSVSITESFSVPAECSGGSGVGPVSDTDASPDEVAENAVVVTPAGITAFAEDPDVGDNVTYNLTLGDAGGRFTIDASSGVVTVAAALDAETATSHTITVQAVSDDFSTSSKDFTIDVIDVDEFDVGPVTDTDASADEVAENASVGSSVGITAFAEDPDVSDSVTYNLTNSAGDLFAINSGTGVITVAAALDNDSITSYSVTVVATSTDGSTSSPRDFTISENEAPDQTVVLQDLGSTNEGRNWYATVGVSAPGASNVSIAATWSWNGGTAPGSCETVDDSCPPVDSPSVRKNIGSVTYTVDEVNGVPLVPPEQITLFKP